MDSVTCLDRTKITLAVNLFHDCQKLSLFPPSPPFIHLLENCLVWCPFLARSQLPENYESRPIFLQKVFTKVKQSEKVEHLLIYCFEHVKKVTSF